MVYLVALLGFIIGFGAGLALLSFMLRHRSKKELLEDKNLLYVYGSLNWIIALGFAFLFAYSYMRYDF